MTTVTFSFFKLSQNLFRQHITSCKAETPLLNIVLIVQMLDMLINIVLIVQMLGVLIYKFGNKMASLLAPFKPLLIVLEKPNHLFMVDTMSFPQGSNNQVISMCVPFADVSCVLIRAPTPYSSVAPTSPCTSAENF